MPRKKELPVPDSGEQDNLLSTEPQKMAHARYGDIVVIDEILRVYLVVFQQQAFFLASFSRAERCRIIPLK